MQFSAGMVEQDYFKERTKFAAIQNEKPDCLGNSYSSRYLFYYWNCLVYRPPTFTHAT